MKTTTIHCSSAALRAQRFLSGRAGLLTLLLALAPGRLTAAPVQLTTSALNDVAPRWHPGGATIAYMKFDGGGNYQPGTVNINGTGEAFLATGVVVPGNNNALSWLGNSTTLLVAEANFFHELFAFNTSLAPFTRVITDGNDAAFTRKLFVVGGRNSSAWVASRDGLIVAWRDSPNVGTPTTIRSATFASLTGQNTDAHGTIVVSSASPTIGARGMSLTPNGGQLVISEPSGTGLDLFLYNTGGGLVAQLTTDGASSGVLNLSPDVSPDGTKLLFQRSPTGAAGTSDIYLMNLSGGGLVQVTSTAGVDEGSPSYAPDGVQYAFQRLDGAQWNIYRDSLVLSPEIGVQQPAGTDLVDGTASIGFGNQNVGVASAAKTFTITNTGTASLTGLAVTTDGSHPGDFTVGALGATTLAPGVSTTFTVTFTPAATGARSAAIHIASNDSDENPFDIALTGTGVPPDYTVTTTGGMIVVTDNSGNGDTLAISEPSAGNIRFAAAGRTFSVDGGAAISGDSGTLSRSGVTQITVNAGAGADILNVGAFAGTLPSLTLNGGTGDDTVNFNGDITFAADANLDVDLQNDDATPGTDIVNTAASANLLTSGTGTITVKVSRNVAMASGSSFETVNGGITLEANLQGTATVANFTGIDLNNAVVKTSGTGNVSLTGKGGNSSGSNSGIVVQGGGSVQSTATGLGAGQGLVSLTGTGGGAGGVGYGVYVTGAGSKVISADGNITIIGQASLTSTHNFGSNLHGCALDSSGAVQSTGAAKVDITGTGGSSTGSASYCFGVYILGATVTTVTGDITITGQGGNSVGGIQNIGTAIYGSSTKVESTGSAKITINGTGGNSGDAVGVDLYYSPTIQSTDGDITIIGQLGVPNTELGGGASALRQSGGGILSLGTANVTLRADYMALFGSVNAGANTVTLRPKTAGRLINLGGSDVINTTLGLTDAELDTVTAGTLIIGDATSGNLTVSAPISPANAPALRLVSGGAIKDTYTAGTDVTVAGLTTDGNLSPGASPGIFSVAGNHTLAANSTFTVEIGGATPGNGAGFHDQLSATGSVTIGANVTLSTAAFGGFVPGVGQSYIIISRTGGSGTFAGLAQGATLANFLGSGLNATISYIGGTGDDVVLAMPAPEIAVEQPAGSNIADGGSKSFGAVNFPSGGTSNLTFTIKNTGSANLTGLGITIDGTHAAMFTVTANPTAPVSGPSGSTTFTVRFAPTSLGAKTAALHIANNDLDENPFDINLTGTGIDYTVTTTASMGAARGNATATLLANGKVLVAGGSGATAEIYDPVTGTWTPTGSMSVSRSYHVAVLLPNGKVLVANGTTAELYDPATGTWTATGSMVANRPGGHTATLLANGKVLVAGGSGATAELYDPATGIWTATGSMTGNRESHTATLLANGKVLVAAGHNGSSARDTAELYDPATGLWTATGSMTGRRFVHTATRLPDGRVLVHGGYSDAPPIGNPVSAQLYDPATGTWSATAGNPSTGREYHRAALLPNGKVLICGGGGPVAAHTSMEVFDPATGLFSAAGSLSVARVQHVMTVLANGKVLIAGGNSGTLTAELYEVAVGAWNVTTALAIARTEHTATLLPNGKVLVAAGQNAGTFHNSSALYDPVALTWTATGNLNTARRRHTATLLANGKVLVAGGATTGDITISSAELYDPATGTWTATASMSTVRYLPTATLLADGKVLLAGGFGSASLLASSELFDPATGTWTTTPGSMGTGRYVHTATLMPDGKVLVAGGLGNAGPVSSSELYDPSTKTWTTTTGGLNTARYGLMATLLPSGKVLVSGGFNAGYLSSAELYDPGTRTWAVAATMSTGRYVHTSTLLPNGKVLVAGGFTTGAGGTASAELYDPASGTWSATGSQTAARGDHTATLLGNGKVLVTGGAAVSTSSPTGITSANLYDTGLGFSPAWQPVISTATSPLVSGGSLALTGTGFRGVSGAGSGGTADSPGDHPVVQLRSLENQQVVFLHATAWSATASTSPFLGGLHAGWTLATVFVNGINSTSSIVYLDAPEMNVTGNGVTISDGDATPATADHTDFGSAAVTGGTVVRTFTIQNTHATLALNLTGTPRVSVSGTHAANFTVTLQPSTPVSAAGGSTTFQVTFTPSATGLRTATLTIANDSAESPYNFAIQGTGAVVPEIGVQQPAGTDLVDGTAGIDFGNQDVSTTSAAKTFTITNSGSASLTGLAITKDGANPGDFSVGALGATTLAPGASTTFTVTFSPSALGSRGAAIHIANNDSDENPFDIALTGTGVDTTPPVITCPANVTVQCDADVPAANFSGGTATDSVDPSPVVTHVGDAASGSCPKSIVRTYRATDASGNTNDCAQTITVHDTTPPMISCPGAVSVQCFGDIPAADTGAVTASDNCGSVTKSHVGDTYATNGAVITVTRTYKATDACGLMATCTQTITVQDTTPPSITCPAIVQGAGTVFTLVASPPVGDNPASVTVGDVNGDGRLDLICANHNHAATLSVLTNDGAGGFGRFDLAVGDGALSVAAGDVNGDGRLDLISANLNPDTLSVLTNDGVGGFGRFDLAVGDGPGSVAVGDVNGDGRLDLICANGYAATLSVLINNGAGGFGRFDLAVGDTPVSVAVGDVNGDGQLDLISASLTTDTLSVLTNDGAGGFGRFDLAVGTEPYSVAAGDVNGDGRLDLISGNSTADTLSVLTNDGAGGFGRIDLAVGDFPRSVAVGDVNGDGRLDLISANINADTLSVLTNNGTGGFGRFDLAVGTGPDAVAVGDVNGDGRLDLINANAYADTLSVLTGSLQASTDPGQCTAVVTYSAPAATDNCPGVSAACNPPSGTAFPKGATTVTCTATDAAGLTASCSFTVTVNDTEAPTINCPPNVTVQCDADVPAANFAGGTANDNCDPNPTVTHVGDSASGSCPKTITRTYRATDASGNTNDCAQTITVHDTTPPVLTCLPIGPFQCIADVPAPSFGGSVQADNCGPGQVTVVHIGDVTNGTCPTIITRTWRGTDTCGNTNDCAQTITVHDTTPPMISCPTAASVQCFGDIPAADTGTVTASDNCGTVTKSHVGDTYATNGIVITVTRTYKATDACGLMATCTQTITVQDTTPPSISCPAIVQGAQTVFTLVASPQVGNYPASVAVGDVNGDGRLDLISANRGSATLSVLTNDGAGGFGRFDVAVGNDPASVAVGDVNGDGRLDLVSAHYEATTLSVLTNDGAGGFVRFDLNMGDQGSHSVAVRDVNGDGRLDLIVANIFGDRLSVLTNDGAGGFGRFDLAVGDAPHSVAVGDANGDGRLDLVSANAGDGTGDGTLSVLTNDGAGGFVRVLPDLAVGTLPLFVTVGDVNGDGRLDLISANRFSDTLTVLTNNGAGGFGRFDLAVGANPTSVTTGDINGDGRLDLISANQDSFTLSVLTNDGAGGFGRFDLAVGAYPTPVTTGDINGDGRLDLICANQNSFTLSVLTGSLQASTDLGQCTAVVTYSAPSATDNCPGVSAACAPPSGTAFPIGTTTVTCTATDAAGLTASCSFTVTVNDTEAPAINCPPNVAVQCDADVPLPNFAGGSVSDNCGPTPAVTHISDVASGSCPKTIVRTYRATDASGNTNDCAQTITVNDTTPPMISCPAAVSVQCFGDIPAADTGAVTASDNCGSVTKSHEGDTYATNGCVITVTRAYKATDACNNMTTCAQTITVSDTMPPSITCPAAVSVQCFGDIPAADTGAVTASDNCGSVTKSHEGDAYATNGCVITVTRTYKATDACNNMTTCAQTITVSDTTPPAITCPAAVSVQCFGDIPAADPGAVTASDNCGSVTKSHEGDTYATNGCVITVARTYKATDACNNMTTCAQTITVSDTTPPAITCPAAVTVQCDADVPAANFTGGSASDNCGGSPAVTHVGDAASGSCPKTIVRTYRATDACGNTNDCAQTITVHDTTPPVLTCLPIGPFQCIADVPAPSFGGSIQADNCGPGQVTVVHIGDVTNGTCPTIITRTWRGTDTCGNTNDCAQTITVNDTTPPMISCPAAVAVQCFGDIPAANTATATASDNCGSVTKSHVGDAYATNGAVITVTRTYKATDPCGLMATCTQTITVQDTTPPTIFCPALVQGARTTFTLVASPVVGDMPQSVAMGDVNGDGLQDLISANLPADTLSVLTNDGAGGFGRFDLAVGDGPLSVAVGDVNGDGRQDLICANAYADTLSVLTNDGVGEFARFDLAVGDVPYSLVAGDANGDGRLDLICANQAANALSVLTNDGAGGFGRFDLAVGAAPHAVAAGDVNGDGRLDLIAANYNANTLSVLTNDGTGGFGRFDLGVGASPRGVTAGDVNGDGRQDLICVNQGANTLSVLTNNGAGGFVRMLPDLAVGALPFVVAAGDVNADGRLDLVCNNGNADTLSVLTNDGAGGFGRFDLAVGDYPVSVVVGDVNGDGRLDLVSANQNSDTLSVLSGSLQASTAPGQCTAVVTYSAPAATDNCPGVSAACAPPSGTAFPKGMTTVTCTATDAAGLTASCSFDVTVNDTEAPAINCPAPIVVGTSGGSCGSNVTFSATATDNCDGILVPTCAPASGDFFPKGVTTVTCTASDSSFNTNTCSFTITVNDTEPPVIGCPAPIAVGTSGGTCASNVTFSVTASDNCGTANVTCSPASGSSFALGATTVNCFAEDGHANTNTCSFTVTVSDTEAPAITCAGNVSVSTSGGTCASNVTFSVTATDNCGTANVTCSPASGSSFALGATTVNCFAEDGHGNTNTCSFTVTVTDTEAPAITCAGNASVSTSGGSCASNVTFSVTATDNCGTANVTCSPASGSSFALGATMVNCFAEDGHANTNTCSFSVTVSDTEPPAITCAGNASVSTSGGTCASNVTFNVTATDNCATANVTCSPASGSSFALGATTVNCFAEDGHANTNTCSFSVTVSDTEPPAITCAGNVSVSTSGGSCASNVTFSVTATDNCGTANVTCSPASGSSFPLGPTTVTCFAEDGHGNTNTCSFTVTVSDTEAPAITCAGNASVSTSGGTCASNVTFNVTATDNCATANVTCSPASGSSFALGATTVNCFAEDGHANTNTCSFTVTVSDTELPQFTCPLAMTNSADAGQCSAAFVLPPLAATDNCAVASVTSNAPASFPVGITLVTWTVVDIHDNTNACEQRIVVRDTQAPSITCPVGRMVTIPADQTNTTVTYPPATASDNCGFTVACAPASGSVFNAGTTVVTCVATDDAGNTNACAFSVVVNRAPIADDNGAAIAQGRPLVVSRAKLLNNDRDPDGDTLTVSSVSASSTNGGTVVLGLTAVTYTPQPEFTGEDRFTYTISDGRGGAATATVVVFVSSGDLPSLNQVEIRPLPGGAVLVRFAGVPGYAYELQRTPSLAPATWTALATFTAPPHGIMEYVDANPPPGMAFYRTATP